MDDSLKNLAGCITSAVLLAAPSGQRCFGGQKKYLQKRQEKEIVLIGAIIATLVRDDVQKIEQYVESILPGYLPDQFKRFFRVTRETFECILVHLNNLPTLGRRECTGGRPQITIDKDLLMTLWYLSTQETVRSISDRFNVQESTFILHNRRLLDIFSDLCKNFIVWPSDAEKQQVLTGFEAIQGFPGVIGAIDGTHISIKPPGPNEADYINRKSYHSVILQAVCKHDKSFTDINCGWPGRVNDAHVFRNSDICRFQSQLCGQNHLIGDGAYPLSRFLMKPYRESANLTQAEKLFNKKLCSTRSVIEHAFAILKARFRRLQHINMNNIEYIVKTIVTCCVLHNICIINHDELDEHFEADIDDQVGIEMPSDTTEGNLKRLFLTRQLSNGHYGRMA